MLRYGGLNMKKILVLGGTGAMGRYLVPKLAQRDYQVDVVSLDQLPNLKNIHYIQSDIMDDSVLEKQLSAGYDGIVDFMVYPTAHFKTRHRLLLENTDHYIFLSSYRVFADSDEPVTEESAQLLDVCQDEEFLASDDYSLKKCRGEDILEQSAYDNWTIVRPAITYSQKRAQLVTLELHHILAAMREHRPVLLPEMARNVQATMTWAGDVAEMLARLLLAPSAKMQAFNVTTAEHNTWEQVAQMYKEIYDLSYQWVDTESYLEAKAKGDKSGRVTLGSRWQLSYDRLYNRVMDNRKILARTGLLQQDLKPLYEGLLLERESNLELL